ncbi:MAG: rhomboid family intramembrane serine protease [Pseudomonadota bacterium]
MQYHTDRQLVLGWLRNFKGLTSVFVLVMIFLNFLTENRGLFAAQLADPFIELMAFDTRHPFRYFGLNLFTSAFVHSSTLHLISNLFWLLGFGLYLEHARGKAKFVQVFCLGHILGILLVFFSNVSPDMHFILGSSSATLAVLGYGIIALQSAFFYFIGILVYFAFIFYGDTSHAHLVPLFVGMLMSGIDHRKNSKA